MEYRTLGKAGLKLSKLAFGESCLGSLFRSVVEAGAVRTVRSEFDLGVNLIDTAP
jgi:aryl-alcohol dehydrogenase-like predicted oxidoreductase